MKQHHLRLPAMFLLAAVSAMCRHPPPLKLVQTISLPANIKGHFDHFGVDLKHYRLFATPEEFHAVLVFDLTTGKFSHTIPGIARPHAIFYREDLNRIYVTDGTDGALKIFEGDTYAPLASVKLLADADSIGYDPVTHYLYIDNGGGDVHETYSMLSIVDTTAAKKLADIKIDGETLEAMALETASSKLYVNNRKRNQVSVIDRNRRTLLASWSVTKGTDNVAMALDEADHRLFVACRSGQVVVIDTETGQEMQALPITKGVDDMVYNRASQRLYAACDGTVDVYKQIDAGHYESIGKVITGPGAKTALLVPELKRYFVATPQHGNEDARILVYAVQ